MVATHSADQAIQDFIYTRTYSKWVPNLGRREVWSETVTRYVDWILKDQPIPSSNVQDIYQTIHAAILNHRVMPSMRAMWSAGEAADRDNTAIYNCGFLILDSIDAFKELLYILMCGTGVGFSCEEQYIRNSPVIEYPTFVSGTQYHTVEDTKEGWANGLAFVLNAEYKGLQYIIDYTKIRPEGSRLKTSGGRAPGPEPLKSLFVWIQALFVQLRRYRYVKLSSMDVHDLACMVAQIVVVGGVRRSSLISLSDYFDPMMRNAKKWPFPEYRGMANNSMIFDEQPASPSFDRFWSELQHSGTGEPGIFNRTAARTKRRSDQIIGTNPCGEIILRDQEFCNLSEAVLRPSDDLISALDKVKIAAMIGVLQSNKTNFPFLRSSWQKNSVDERLLGVSLTGEYDSYHLMNDQDLRVLKEMVHSTAKSFSKMLGIKTPVAMTCVKPSGTVSQLVNASSGAHPRYASHYIRRYRISEGDPLYQLILESGFETTKDYLSDRTQVLEFPVAAPRHAITKDQVTAEQQLDHYLTLQRSWTDHNTSITIYVRPDEWKNLGQKVYKNWNHIVAVSFLPADDADHHYELAPYEEINAAEYNKRLDKLPAIDYNRLPSFETEDTTEGEREYACVGNQCDLLL